MENSVRNHQFAQGLVGRLHRNAVDDYNYFT